METISSGMRRPKTTESKNSSIPFSRRLTEKARPSIQTPMLPDSMNGVLLGHRIHNRQLIIREEVTRCWSGLWGNIDVKAISPQAICYYEGYVPSV